MNTGVILYGPPAVGKDTITTELVSLDVGITHFERLKCGPGRTAGYRMISREQLTAITPASILWSNDRYGAVYLVDREGLDQIWHLGLTPVIHLGQPEAIDAITTRTSATRWLVVDLHAALQVLEERIPARGTRDDVQRLTVAAGTPRLTRANLAIDTGITEPTLAARMIAGEILADGGPPALVEPRPRHTPPSWS